MRAQNQGDLTSLSGASLYGWPRRVRPYSRESRESRARAMRVNLADAARMTGRPEATIRRWIARGVFESGAALREECPGRPTITTQGTAAWSIDVAALELVHRTRGGVYWRPEVAERVRLPSHLARRLALVEHLENEVARLHRLVDALQARGSKGGAG